MATLEQIFSYEQSVENAWASILKAAGLSVVVEFENIEKETPFVEVHLDSLAPLPNYRAGAWMATLKSRVVTQRKKNSDQHYDMLARIRIEAASFRDRFNLALLPSHSIEDMRETGLSRGTEPDRSLDWSELDHRIIFAVRPEAWPAD